jgi:hypothetical protein
VLDEYYHNPDKRGWLGVTRRECFRCGAPGDIAIGGLWVCEDCDAAAFADEDPNTDDPAPGGEPADTGLQADVDVETGVWPADLENIEQWLTWKETTDGRKVPRAPYETGDDTFVSAQDPDIWTTFDEAREWAATLPGFGLAFNIRDRDEYPGEELVLVDYDDARDPETGDVHPTVRDHIERAGSYADVSTSGTGVHIFCRGALPDGVKAVDAPLPEAEGFPDAEIEVYDSARYSAMTGHHIVGTPAETRGTQAFLDELAEEFATVAEGTPDELTREPETPKAELVDVDTTDDIQDVLDAIQHTGPRDISLASTVTHERGDGTKSMDPSWAPSKSGTRLAQVDDGWVYRKGMVGLDALQVVALEEGIIRREDQYPSGEAFWRAVEALRERGAHIPEYEPSTAGDTEHVPILPDDDRLTESTSGWDWRHAGRRATDEDPLQGARDRTVETIADQLGSFNNVLVEALPTLGKSYGTIAAAAQETEPITVLTTRGHKEQYEQIREWCREHGLSTYTLPSFTRDCETANGSHGEDWARRAKDWYHRGATPKDIHKNAEYELGRPLPCQEHGSCQYASKWDFDPDDYDVLIGHYAHGHKRKVTSGRTVVYDEFPEGAYETCLDHGVEGAISYFLQCHDDLEFDDYTDLVEGRHDDQRRADALQWFADHDPDRDGTLVFGDEAGHAAAPLAAMTILAGATEDLGNGWERADLDDGRVGLFDREQGRVWLLTPPALEYTRGTVALDGTPTKELWETALGERLTHTSVLSDGERREYLTEALNLNLVRTTDAVKTYTMAEKDVADRVSLGQDAALLEAVREQHDERPALISAKRVLEYYDEEGVTEHVDGTAYYGNVLGSNEFAERRLGVVIGAGHYGDHYVKKWGAYAGRTVEASRESDGEGRYQPTDYGTFGNKIRTHMREHETLQAAMRFGRDGNGAVVYVHTNTLPDWVPLAGEGRVVSTWSEGMRQVLDAVRDDDAWRTRDVADHPAVEISERQVRDHLHTLVERGYLSRHGEGRGYVWRDDGLHRVGAHGDVELDPISIEGFSEEEVAEVSRMTNYTWEFRNSASEPGLLGSDPAGAGGDAATPAADHSDAPPDSG